MGDDGSITDPMRRTTMQYRTLGRTGVQVSALCMRTMMFGAWGNSDEAGGALTGRVGQRRVRYLGCSTFPAFMIVESQWVSERRGLARFACEQPPYSIFVRHIELDVLPVTQRYGMGVIAWSPLAGG